MKPIHVYRKIIRNGVEIKVKNKKYQVTYESFIWKKFPKSLHRFFADSLSYISTWHLSLIDEAPVVYHFPHPPIEPLFFKLLLYSIPMNIFENKINGLTTSQLLKKFYNFSFQTKFKSLNHPYMGKHVKKMLKERALLLFSFGKDSLLTFALLEELGVKVIPVFMREPQSSFENAHKRKLAERFYNKFEEEVVFFPLSIGRLRQAEDLCWGWDIILSQYSLILLPYYFAYKTKYVFFGNEQSCNFYLYDQEKFLVNPVFEQSIYAMQHLNDIPKQFLINTHIGSLVEPIHEIFISYILHHRYPDFGRFQMSCFSEEERAKKKRWCGVCEKCARMYIFFKALNFSPERVGFYEEMLSNDKEKYFVIFDDGKVESTYGSSGLGKDEQLLAFYLAYKNGAKGALIEKFKQRYLNEVEKKKDKLIEEYFGIHSSFSLPSSLRGKVLRIYKKEQEKVLKYIKRITST